MTRLAMAACIALGAILAAIALYQLYFAGIAV